MQHFKSLIVFLLTIAFSIQFEATTEKYDEQLAKQLLDFSAISYCTLKKIQSWNCGGLCKSHQHIIDIETFSNNKENQGVILFDQTQNAIILAFRGTNASDVQNMYTNLDISFVNYPHCEKCKAHQGFRDSQEAIHKKVLPLVRKYRAKYAFSKFYITGHSLGGAIAVLTQLDLLMLEEKQKFKEFSVTGIQTFGQPRLGNAEFAKWVAEKTPTKIWRVVNRMDMIPQIPPSFFPQKHFPWEVWYQKNRPQVICEPNEGDYECKKDKFMANVDDHFGYVGSDFRPVRDPCMFD